MRDTCKKIFGEAFRPHYPLFWDGPVDEPELRMADDLKGLFASPGCVGKGPLYAMFRDLAKSPADRWWMQQNGLRYDITVVLPQVICGEFIKTKGHYHPKNAAGAGYPEIYTVLDGTAHYLLQREDLADVVLVTATKGDIVVVPPEYGHVTINPSPDQALHMANIVSSRFASDYSQYVTMKGAAYYELADGSWQKNRAYPKVPPLRQVTAGKIPVARAGFTSPLYALVEKRNPVLGFLNHPEQFPQAADLAFP
ncbi:MAG: glucose-6-phosphate isomerase [Methanomicrobiales archaeon]|nr:glucose-6-phosphate isomerase [Methanomicrobiales archaeon]